ncbi:hypothetical protein GCM10009741_71370 [Kribbella lupini]|uniref:Uncharacterized protein n=1 Tax=Kribbella lupini TaxID=291602 RepID=A0ABN2CCV1_9ACTN
MGGDVAGAVGDRVALTAAAEPGQRPVRRTPGAQMAVVDCDRQPVLEPLQYAGPGGVAGGPDLGAVAWFGQRPPGVEPGAIVAFGNGTQREILQQITGFAVVGELGQFAGDVVEPLVGDHQAGELRRQLVVELDAGNGQVGRQSGNRPAELAGAGADVGEVVQADLAHQPNESTREQR